VILGLGIDLCEVDRVARLLQKDRQRFLRRVFLEGESEFCEARRRPEIHYAARLAAKEAFLKAVGRGWSLGWQEVEIIRESSGKPALVLSGGAEEVTSRRGVRKIHLTLTHTASLAAAVVVLEGNPGRSPEGGGR